MYKKGKTRIEKQAYIFIDKKTFIASLAHLNQDLFVFNNPVPVETERISLRPEGNRQDNEYPKMFNHQYYKH